DCFDDLRYSIFSIFYFLFSLLEKLAQIFYPSMLKPVAIAHGENCDHRNRQKNSRHSGQLRAAQYSKNHCERMQVYALAYDARVDCVVFDDAQHAQKYSDRDCLAD